MLKKIALATIFAAVSVVSFTSSANLSAANATVAQSSQAVPVPALGGPVMQGMKACSGCR